MAAGALIAESDFMEEDREEVPPGIPRLMNARMEVLDLTREELLQRVRAAGVNVSMRTLDRWKSGETTPDIDRRTKEDYRPALATALDVELAEVIKACQATDTWRSDQPRMERSGVPARFSVLRWVTRVRRDGELGEISQIAVATMVAITYRQPVIGDAVFEIDWDQIATDAKVAPEDVRDALPEIMHSGYVRRIDSLSGRKGEWVLRLELPEG